ncbi:hypothetical protein DFH09DRAFT_1286307 [Mycena vulgaris]|nr:hypothetical protein DFH09DRAFT_1286307 [Mycena vulgaris]
MVDYNGCRCRAMELNAALTVCIVMGRIVLLSGVEEDPERPLDTKYMQIEQNNRRGEAATQWPIKSQISRVHPADHRPGFKPEARQAEPAEARAEPGPTSGLSGPRARASDISSPSRPAKPGPAAVRFAWRLRSFPFAMPTHVVGMRWDARESKRGEPAVSLTAQLPSLSCVGIPSSRLSGNYVVFGVFRTRLLFGRDHNHF